MITWSFDTMVYLVWVCTVHVLGPLYSVKMLSIIANNTFDKGLRERAAQDHHTFCTNFGQLLRPFVSPRVPSELLPHPTHHLVGGEAPDS